MADEERAGRGLRRAGAVVAAVGLAVGIALAGYGVLFASRRSAAPIAFTMPGSTTATLEAGEYGIYSPLVDGTHSVAYPQEITVIGPSGEVPTRETFGLLADTANLVEGDTTYQVFNRFKVTTPGRYDVAIEADPRERDVESVPVRLATYVDEFATVGFVLLGITAAAPILLVGLLLWFIGLIVRGNARRRAEEAANLATHPYPGAAYPPGPYSPANYPPGTYPPAHYPPGTYPPNAYPPASYPPPTYPPGTYPPGTYPPASHPPTNPPQPPAPPTVEGAPPTSPPPPQATPPA